MTVPRVALLEDNRAEVAAAAGVPGYFADVNLYRALLRHPGLAKPIADLVVFLWRRATMDARLRELVIMRVAWLTDCNYEWAHHWDMAQRAGLTEDQLLALRDIPDTTRFSTLEVAVLAAVDEVIDEGAVSERTWGRLLGLFGDDPVPLMELLCVISTWRTVSELIRSLAVPLEDGFPDWAPDGVGPAASAADRRRHLTGISTTTHP